MGLGMDYELDRATVLSLLDALDAKDRELSGLESELRKFTPMKLDHLRCRNCENPGPACADQTLAMVEELRQRGVCASNHGESSEHQARLAEAERALVEAQVTHRERMMAWDGRGAMPSDEWVSKLTEDLIALRAKKETNGVNDDGFECCGGNDDTPKLHTLDCCRHGDPMHEEKARAKYTARATR